MKIRYDFVKFLDEVKLPIKGVDKILNIWHQNKKQLALKLGANEENDFRVNLGNIKTDVLTRHDDNPLYYLARDIKDFIRDREGDFDNEIDFLANKFAIGKNTMKISRYLSKNLEGFRRFVDDRSNLYWYFENITDDGRHVDINSLIPTFFEYVRMDADLFISLNPCDIVGVNHNASYRSCLNVNSCYFNSTLSYLCDKMTVISLAKKKDKKIGRAWVYILPRRKMIVQPKSYGTFTKEARKEVRAYIKDSFGMKSSVLVKSKLRARNASTVNGGSGAVFVDVNHYSICAPKNTKDSVSLSFKDPRCLICGSETKKGDSGFCFNCDPNSVQCHQCSVDLHREETYWYYVGDDEIPYCGCCYNELFRTCHRCHNSFEMEKMEKLDVFVGGDFYVCKDCNPHIKFCRCGRPIYDHDTATCSYCRINSRSRTTPRPSFSEYTNTAWDNTATRPQCVAVYDEYPVTEASPQPLYADAIEPNWFNDAVERIRGT